jgi:hypothetical protein
MRRANTASGYTLRPESEWNAECCDGCAFLSQCLPVAGRAGTTASTAPRLQYVFAYMEHCGVTMRALQDATPPTYLILKLNASLNMQQSSAIFYIPSERWPGMEPTPPHVDFDIIAIWLRAMEHQASFKENRPDTSSLELTVIDCTTRTLVLLPAKKPYVTLSYVWGGPEIAQGPVDEMESCATTAQYLTQSLPKFSPLPPTIEDSITVCSSLGFRYLWVDRYCILQHEAQERASQIRQMDKIYADSSLTIVACAGVDPRHGLPGISRPRNRSPSLKLGDHGYLQMIPTVSDIHTSVWATRGWTYQEALLARRRLYFTDRQVYFEADEMVKSEFSTRAPVLTPSVHARIHSQAETALFGDIYRCIEAYSRRQLSYPADALNALVGIMASYEHNAGIRHHWGLPFQAGTSASPEEYTFNSALTFENSLNWQIVDSSSHRREGFPTWSWTGWANQVSWDQPVAPSHLQIPNSDRAASSDSFHIEAELNSGVKISWQDYQQRYQELNSLNHADQLSQFIHIETFTSPIRFLEESHSKDYILGLERYDGMLLPFRTLNPASLAAVTYSAKSPNDEFLVMHTSQHNFVVLVRNAGEHWERVALLSDHYQELRSVKKTLRKIRLG